MLVLADEPWLAGDPLVIISVEMFNLRGRWMMDNQKDTLHGKAPKERREGLKRITTIGWGLFFIWLGVVLMIKAGSGLILLGVGLISLGMQVARKYSGLDSDGFWIIVGLLFVIVGIWEMFEINLPLMSVFLIVIGGAFLISALKGKGEKG